MSYSRRDFILTTAAAAGFYFTSMLGFKEVGEFLETGEVFLALEECEKDLDALQSRDPKYWIRGHTDLRSVDVTQVPDLEVEQVGMVQGQSLLNYQICGTFNPIGEVHGFEFGQRISEKNGEILDPIQSEKDARRYLFDKLVGRGQMFKEGRARALNAYYNQHPEVMNFINGVIPTDHGSIFIIGKRPNMRNLREIERVVNESNSRLAKTGERVDVIDNSISLLNHNGNDIVSLYYDDGSTCGSIYIPAIMQSLNFLKQVSFNDRISAALVQLEFELLYKGLMYSDLSDPTVVKARNELLEILYTEEMIDGALYTRLINGSSSDGDIFDACNQFQQLGEKLGKQYLLDGLELRKNDLLERQAELSRGK